MSYCGILEIIDLGTSYETGEELHLLSVKLSMLLSFSLSDGYLENYPMPSCDGGLLMLNTSLYSSSVFFRRSHDNP